MQTPNVNMPGYYPGTGKGQNAAVILIVVVVLAIVIYIVVKFFGGISGIFDFFKSGTSGIAEKLGIKDTAQEASDKAAIQKAKELAGTVSSPWNSTYFSSAPSGSLLITTANAKSLSKQIYDSVGVISDDSDKALAAFKTLKTKTQVSFLCKVFNDTYGQDLFSFMQFHFDTEQQVSNLASIISYVDSLSPYKA